MTQDGVSDIAARFADLPITFLQAELHRRQANGERPACGSDNTNRVYNFPLHVAALFLILILSTLACSFPLIVRCFPKLPVPHHALFISRHFGTGVLIATAFVHLLPTAYTNLTNACLPPFWTKTYPEMPGFIAMVSVIVVVGIEMFFAMRGAGHSHHVDFNQLRGHDGAAVERPAGRGRSTSFNSFRHVPLDDMDGDAAGRSPYVDTPQSPSSSLNKPLPRTPSPGREDVEDDDDDDLDLDELDPNVDDMQPLTRRTPDTEDDDQDLPMNGHANGDARPGFHKRKVSWADHDAGTHQARTPAVLPTAQEQRLVLQCLMLEAGILFHSVFIGLAVSVSTGSSFVVLLVAISFHQTFEGLALGSRIASIGSFSTSSYKPWLMCVMYGITTPIGQAIGLGVQGLYDPASELGLLMVGIMNAISSGLLIYAGLVQLLAEDFLSEASYAELRGKRRIQACASVVAGCTLMALVGVWA
ncbi:Putative zinc/iron permease [Septoria linicola]|uniref:Zinc/iron permease n=1 Tax=Septoria linicola TaxID=215465 RepID=A0A9Q9EM05_9PEZI|nr:Putative zinc/iron permease [Septoria linicola]